MVEINNMANSTMAKPHALVNILSTVFIVYCGSTFVWKKEWAGLPLDMLFHQFLCPLAVAVALD